MDKPVKDWAPAAEAAPPRRLGPEPKEAEPPVGPVTALRLLRWRRPPSSGPRSAGADKGLLPPDPAVSLSRDSSRSHHPLT